MGNKKKNRHPTVTKITCPAKGEHNLHSHFRNKLKITLILVSFFAFLVGEFFHYVLLDRHIVTIEFAAVLTSIVHLANDFFES